MKETVDTILSLSASMLNDMTKSVDGNKAAAARARKASLELERLLKQYRKESVRTGKETE